MYRLVICYDILRFVSTPPFQKKQFATYFTQKVSGEKSSGTPNVQRAFDSTGMNQTSHEPDG